MRRNNGPSVVSIIQTNHSEYTNLRRQNEKLELLDDAFQTMLKLQPEMKEALKYNLFQSQTRKKCTTDFQIF